MKQEDVGEGRTVDGNAIITILLFSISDSCWMLNV
jgi:hypothetical protein